MESFIYQCITPVMVNWWNSSPFSFFSGKEILMGTPRKMYVSLGLNGFHAIGYMMLPLFAYFCRDWTTLMMAMSVPCIAYIPLWWWVWDIKIYCVTKGDSFCLLDPWIPAGPSVSGTWRCLKLHTQVQSKSKVWPYFSFFFFFPFNVLFYLFALKKYMSKVKVQILSFY